MNRRHFTQRLALAAGATTLLPTCRAEAQKTAESSTTSTTTQVETTLLRGKALKKGDTVGLITPGSFIPERDLAKAERNMEALGLTVKRGKHLRELRGFNAGTDAQRLEDLHAMFADPDVDAIWCARGGYGCTRLLPDIDFDLIRQNPKILIGYSDITALTTAIFQQTGLICFHGPVAASTLTDYTRAQVERVLFNAGERLTIEPARENLIREDELYKPQLLYPGKASGRLIGGNLSLLAAMAGTPWALQPSGKLLFMEDIEEKPYRIDRMLTQLHQSSPLTEAAGFALGIFAGCEPEPEDNSLTLAETLVDQISPLEKPAIYGLSFGHIGHQCTLPVGVQATLDAEKRSITLNEPWLRR